MSSSASFLSAARLQPAEASQLAARALSCLSARPDSHRVQRAALEAFSSAVRASAGEVTLSLDAAQKLVDASLRPEVGVQAAGLAALQLVLEKCSSGCDTLRKAGAVQAAAAALRGGAASSSAAVRQSAWVLLTQLLHNDAMGSLTSLRCLCVHEASLRALASSGGLQSALAALRSESERNNPTVAFSALMCLTALVVSEPHEAAALSADARTAVKAVAQTMASPACRSVVDVQTAGCFCLRSLVEALKPSQPAGSDRGGVRRRGACGVPGVSSQRVGSGAGHAACVPQLPGKC